MAKPGKITIRALILGTLFSGLFALITVYFENRKGLITTANQIAVLPFVLLLLSVLLINPVCRLIRVVRRFSVTEVLVVFIMCSVSAGISTFGLASQVVPIMGGLYNEHWNNEQSRWDLYAEPFLKDSYFLSEPGIHRAGRRAYRDAVLDRERAEAAGDAARAADLAKRVEGLKAELRRFEKKAFEKVKLFRRGLPKSMRAYPGFIKLPDEPLDAYLGRWRRLLRGLSALSHLRRASEGLAGAAADQPVPAPERRAELESAIAGAVERLEPVGATGELLQRKKELSDQWERANSELLKVRDEIESLREERRLAAPEDFAPLGAKIADLTSRAGELEREKKDAVESRESLQLQLDAAETVAATVAGLRALQESLGGKAPPTAGQVTAKLAELMQRFPTFDASLRRFLIGEVPWSDWLVPLASWALIIGITYVVLMALNVLMFRQWAHNERLIYPLAKLPELLAGADESKSGFSVPSIFRSGLFWVGFAIAGSVMGWNLLARTYLIPGLNSLDIGISWSRYIANSPLAGLRPGARSSIFFTMIGLAFMIPSRISFSLWFFWIFYMVQILFLVWLGFGVNEDSFPVHWWYRLNFRTAQGGGALMVFAAVILWKCRRYILCFFMPASVRGLEDAERVELRVSSVLFLLGSLGLILLLWQGMGANIWYTLICYGVIIALSVGLARAVTEGGILGFQAWVSPFHFIRTLFGMNKSWTAPPLYAPLMVYYSALFLDIKTFIVPSMANSIKIRDDLKMGRIRFHLSIILCILVAAGVALAAHIIMSYGQGADNMSKWFYSAFPQQLYGKITSMTRDTPTDNTNCHLWLAFGALLMAGLLFFRRRVFWLPHPIGLIMLVNRLMAGYWFSLFIGWSAKSLVTKYGNRQTYEKVRNLFIGLIIGELFIVVLSMIVSHYTGMQVGIDLNR